MSTRPVPAGCATWLTELKHRIYTAPNHPILATNESPIRLHYSIDAKLRQHQHAEDRDAAVVERISTDLRNVILNMPSRSRRNVIFRRGLAATWTNLKIVQQPAARLPWHHRMARLIKPDDDVTRNSSTFTLLADGRPQNRLLNAMEKTL